MLKEKVLNSKIIPLTDSVKERPDYDELNVIDKDLYEDSTEEVVRFRYTLSAVRLYKMRVGREFFQDFAKATTSFTEFLKMANAKDLDNLTDEDQMNLLPMLSDPAIMQFVMDLIPCMYTKIVDGLFIQNNETADEAESSSWIMDLVNVQFFATLFAEISSNMGDSKQKKAVLRAVK